MADKRFSSRSIFRAYAVYGYAPQSVMMPLLAFAGESCDRVTGCYLLGRGHRAYNPFLMRFYSSDRHSPFGDGGVNSYAYCQGDPVNHLDPSGRMKVRLPVKRHNPLRQLFNRELHGASVSSPFDSLRPMGVKGSVNKADKASRLAIYSRVTDNAIALLGSPDIGRSRDGVLQKDAQFIQFNVVIHSDSPQQLSEGIKLVESVLEQRRRFLSGRGELHPQDPELKDLSELRDIVRSKVKEKP